MKFFSACACVGLLASLSAGVAVADGLHVRVGDLSSHDAAVGFDHRLTGAAARFCFGRYRPTALSAIAACKKAVREEALEQLTSTQRDAFAAALRPQPTLANAR